MFTALLVGCAAAVRACATRFPLAGTLPGRPAAAAGSDGRRTRPGGFLVVAVSQTGPVPPVTPLRTSPPFAELLERERLDLQFRAAAVADSTSGVTACRRRAAFPPASERRSTADGRARPPIVSIVFGFPAPVT